MPYLTKEDFNTHLYKEVREEIAREYESADNADLLQSAIDRAIAQAKGYLRRFDVSKLFGFTVANVYTAPVIEDGQLKGVVKDLALWHFIQVANANIEMGRVQACYENAERWLKQVTTGIIMPDGWEQCYRDTTDQTAPQGDSIVSGGREPRNNYF